MSVDLRPSRLWGHLLKYYITGFLLSLAFILKVLTNTGNKFAILLINSLKKTPNFMGFTSLIKNFVPPLSIHFLAIGLIFVLIAEIKRLRIKYILFDDGVVKKVGFLNTEIKDVSYTKTDSVNTTRSIIEKIFGIGDLKIETPARPEALNLEGVSHPKKWVTFIIERAGVGGD